MFYNNVQSTFNERNTQIHDLYEHTSGLDSDVVFIFIDVVYL